MQSCLALSRTKHSLFGFKSLRLEHLAEYNNTLCNERSTAEYLRPDMLRVDNMLLPEIYTAEAVP